MIVTCSQCQTQFRLDDERVGPRGLRVRCSLCQHAFSVPPPAAESGPAEAPPVESPRSASERAPEESWSFDGGDPASQQGEPAREDGGPREEQGAAGAVAEEEAAGTGAALLGDEDLGSPESWNFVAGIPAADPAERAPELVLADAADRAPVAVAPAADLSRPPASAPAELAPPPLDAEAASARERAEPAGPGWLARAHATAAWLGTAALCAWGVFLVAVPDRVSLQSFPAELSRGGLEVRVEGARYVENAVAGPLLVVSGELRNPASSPERGPLLVLVLEDAAGRTLRGSEAPLGPRLQEADLRELPPEALGQRQWDGARSLALRPLRRGERGHFDAVVVGPPPEARSWRIEVQAQAGAAAAGAAPPRPEAFPR